MQQGLSFQKWYSINFYLFWFRKYEQKCKMYTNAKLQKFTSFFCIFSIAIFPWKRQKFNIFSTWLLVHMSEINLKGVQDQLLKNEMAIFAFLTTWTIEELFTRTKNVPNVYLNKVLSKCLIILRKKFKWLIRIFFSHYFNQKLIILVITIEFTEWNSFCKVVFHFFLLSL